VNGEFEAGLSAAFHATHSLKGNFGPACEVHPHDYRVDVAVRGKTLTEDGVVLDIALLERAVGGVVGGWDQRCLDDIADLQDMNTTVEALARFLHKRVSTALHDHAGLLLEVKVWESLDVWGAYRGPVE
jgi:6-pyruvoyltetrahydropterin/6-carboxytetrahydropterin synthase